MKGNIRRSFLFNLGIVLALCLLLYISFFATLKCITRHGKEGKIPDVRGKDLAAAIAELRSLHFDVAVDSTFEPDMKPLSVLKQVPDTGSIVKQGRTVFLTVNMLSPTRIPMPALVNLSFRSAEMLLKNNKLKLGDTTLRPDINAGAVLEMSYNGQPLKAGDIVPQGAKINLVVGDGMGNNTFDVPAVTGMTVDEAELILSQYNLRYILVPADDHTQISDTLQAMVIDQLPLPNGAGGKPNTIKAGDIVNLRIK